MKRKPTLIDIVTYIVSGIFAALALAAVIVAYSIM